MFDLEQRADLLLGNVYDFELSVLRRIGERVKSIGKMSVADAQALNNIADVTGDLDAVIEEMARMTGQNIRDVQQMYADLIDTQHGANRVLYDYRKKPFVPVAENDALKALVNAYAKTTAETMINLSKTKAKKLGFVVNGKFKAMDKAYVEVLDKAVMQVATGASDYNSAMRDAIGQLGGSGLRVNYGGGKTRRLDTAIRQSVLWGAKQASVEYNEQLGEELGCDGIEIDWHGNPRPSHEFMQGKQYSLHGKKTIKGITYESADEALERLQDYNCYHFKTPIILGISEPTYSPEELERLNRQNAERYELDGVSKTGYEWSQDMRKLETAIREERSKKNIAQACGDKVGVKQYNQRINAYTEKYNQIAHVSGIKPNYNRMGIVRPGNGVKESLERGITKKHNQTTAENRVDIAYISSREYRDKFQKLPFTSDVCDAVYKESKALLEHRKGTYLEDICLIDAETGKRKAISYSIGVENEVHYSEKVEDIVSQNPNRLIAIHNHGTNNPPTGSDYTSAGLRKYNAGVVVCHDGTVFLYRPGSKPFTRNLFDYNVDKRRMLGYTEKESIMMTIREFQKTYGIEWSEL